MKYRNLIVVCALTCFIEIHAQVQRKTPDAEIKLEQWEVVDIVFNAKHKTNHPFTTKFQAEFILNDQKKVIPGFFNGGNEWIIRFSATETGTWHFIVESDVKAINGKKGQITVTANTNPDKHGGIMVFPENPQHFYYEDHTPYMQLAFECDWLFALDYHNKTGIPKTEHLLDLLVKYRMNQIVTTVYSFDVNWTKDPKLVLHPEHEYGGDLTIYPFLGTNAEPDFSKLNVEFFQNFDRVIASMNERNISAHLMIYVWNKLVNWPDPESEADNMYFDYIIKRYQAFPNIVWDVSKEALNNPRCSEEYGRERISRIRKLDAYNRLVSVHDYGFCTRNSDVVDFISVQSWSSSIYSFMNNIRSNFPAKPVFNIEHGGYEVSPYDVWSGDFISPEICIRRNYLISFAGGYSTYYWQGASWNAIIHNPFKQPDDFIKPKFEYYKHYVEFFEKQQFENLVPDLSSNASAYCLTNNQGLYLIYIPKENYKFSVFWTAPVFSKTGTIQWFNTLTGEYTPEEQYTGNDMKHPWYMEADAILIRKH